MRGLILAGGNGTRLQDLTICQNKHILPIYKYPMIYYPLFTLIEAGIKDIMIVMGGENIGNFATLLKSGKRFGANITYRVQEEADGIAGAVSLAEDFCGDRKIVIILGDNIFENNINYAIHKFAKQESGARVLVKRVPDPQRFGVAEIDDEKIISIEEKPLHPKSNYIVVGAYMYDNKVFDIIRDLAKSSRGEYEITDVNNEYMKADELYWDEVKGGWIDAGTHESLLRATNEVKAWNKKFF
jgi:glucose-1-phosphate thymidylyltransferase